MRMINIFKLATLCILGITIACSVSPEIDREMSQRAKDTLDIKQKAAVPDEPIPDDVVRVKNDIWLGDTSKVEFEGEPIPSYLETKDGITLISNRPITLYEIGSMVNKITSIAVRYAPELEETVISQADGNKPSMDDIGTQWTDSSKMLVNYKGPMSGLLDEVSNYFNIWWKYERGEIYFYKYITKTFVIYSLPTSPSLSVTVGGSGDTGGSSISQSSSIDGLGLWDDLENTLQSMISQDGNMSVNKSNGTITVTSTPTNIKQIAKYVNELNNRVSKQIAISVKVIQLNVTNKDTYNFNLEKVLFKGRGSIQSITASSGLVGEDLSNLSMAISSKNWDVNTIMQALSTEGQTNLVTSGTVTTMNNKPAPIQVVKKQNYISNITKTNSGDSDNYDISVDTEEIETGFTMSVLPRILDHGRILMFFNLTLSDLLALDTVPVGGGDEQQTIQNPKTETRGFTQEVAMKSGETLVLAGYERVEDSVKKQGVGSPDNLLLGGGSSAEKDRTILVIMLTPVVLESPLTPESRMRD